MQNNILLLCLLAILPGCAQKVVYKPLTQVYNTQAIAQLNFEDVYLTSGKCKLNAWYLPAPGAKLTILYFHGNYGNLSYCVDTVRFFHNAGYNFFAIDYRGYGKSTGKPSEKGTAADALAAWNWLIDQKHASPDTIVICGRSLGGAIAAQLAEKVDCAGLWLESTFTSCRDLGSVRYPRWLVNLICQYNYPTIKKIKEVHCPVLVVHSPEDEMIPFKMGRRLYDAANQPKQFVTISGNHSFGFQTSGQTYTTPVITWLRSLRQ